MIENLLFKLSIFKQKILTAPKRWKNFKYDPFYDICPHCGVYLLNGDLNKNDEVCCPHCGSTKLPKRYIMEIDVSVLKKTKEISGRLIKEAEEKGLPFWTKLFNPEIIETFSGEKE